MKSEISRRELLKLLSKLSCSLYLAPLVGAGCGPISRIVTGVESSDALDNISPINRSLSDGEAQRSFFGDNPTKAHSILWNKAAYLADRGGVPKPTLRRKVVVIGGGISGLTSAWLLRDLEPLILEQGLRLGGNSQGQSWRGIDYSIGAAYFCVPEDGDPMSQLLSSLSLDRSYIVAEDSDTVAIGGALRRGFWSGEVAKNTLEATQLKRLSRYLEGVYNEESMSFPDACNREESAKATFRALDRISIREHLTEKFSALTPPVIAAVEQYCWSSFAASSAEVSASAGLNFLASEFGPIGVFAGGNAAIAERLTERLQSTLPAGSLRTQSTVVDITVSDKDATVSYVTENGELVSVEAEIVVVACPKFVAARIINNLEERRLEAIKQIEYRSYIVANVLLDGDIAQRVYDLYLLGELGVTGNDPRGESQKRGATDVIVANYAAGVNGSSVLTLYQGLPYRGGRAELLAEGAYQAIRGRFESQITDEILPLFGSKSRAIRDLRITRWGHPIPVAAKGFVADKHAERAHAPFRHRVFFVEQDNWALPGIETSVNEAAYWTPKIRRAVLG